MTRIVSHIPKPFVFLIALIGILLITPACRTKSGCPTNGDMAPKVNRKGEIKKKKGSTQLYSKKMRKRMKKN